MSLSSFLGWLVPAAVTPQAIRSEIYFLGSRHHGEALNGALMELKSNDRGPDRSRLLRAVINELKRDQR